MTPNELEVLVIRNTSTENVELCMRMNFLKRERLCESCVNPLKLVKYKRSIDEVAWRCMNSKCLKYKTYFSIRDMSFFQDFNVSLALILRVLCKYASRQPMHSIKLSLDTNKNTVEKILIKLKERIPTVDFSNNKLGGPGFKVQIDETMLNFKIKSHRGRSPINRTDSLCIVEIDQHITRAFACEIPNKQASTLIPIICRQVASNSIISTDEHRSYSTLGQYFSSHNTVCHKYEFVNSINGVHTQSIESFHNELKLEIKRRKGVLSENRTMFLNEFCFYFNHRNNFFNSLLEIIKIN